MRRLAEMVLPTCIISVEASWDSVCTINHHPKDDRLACLVTAIEDFTNSQCPDLNLEIRLMQGTLDEAASMHCNQFDRMHLLAATAPHSGAWLSAVPVEVFGLLLSDDAVCSNVALRLGTCIQQLHCCHCGAMSDSMGYYNLSCHRNPSHLPCHPTLNVIY